VAAGYIFKRRTGEIVRRRGVRAFRVSSGFPRAIEGAERCNALRLVVFASISDAHRLAALHFGVFLTMRGRAFREGNLAGATRSTGIFIPAHLPFPSAELPAGGPSTAGRSPRIAPMSGCEPATEAPAVSRNSNASRCALDGNDKQEYSPCMDGSQELFVVPEFAEREYPGPQAICR
jgi:hypothetical protein